MKYFNDTLVRLMLAALFLGLFLYLPIMDTMLLDLTDADPAVVAFFQISVLIGAVAALIGGDN